MCIDVALKFDDVAFKKKSALIPILPIRQNNSTSKNNESNIEKKDMFSSFFRIFYISVFAIFDHIPEGSFFVNLFLLVFSH